jgi:hypothetical protein
VYVTFFAAFAAFGFLDSPPLWLWFVVFLAACVVSWQYAATVVQTRGTTFEGIKQQQ